MFWFAEKKKNWQSDLKKKQSITALNHKSEKKNAWKEMLHLLGGFNPSEKY